MSRHVLVIGGGISGVQAALDLAQMGIQATIVEEAPSIGGRMAQLDKTFPTNDCSTCILSPKLIELSNHPLITILSYSSVENIAGTNGTYTAAIRQKARYVDEEKCTACGLCAEKCPVKITDSFNRGITQTKCIHIPYAQAVPAVYRIDGEHCLYLTKGKCGVCSKICQAGAIDYTQTDTVSDMSFDAVILSSGAEEYSPRIRPEYGYGIFPNVITSIEYERFLSASGPTGGHILRPSDQAEPRRVAFIQCVGSRDLQENNNSYCSAYCCMQATKEAVITREHAKETDATIFYIDLRAFGKGFDRYVQRAKEEYGVRYIRSRVSEIEENPENGNVNIQYLTPEGSHVREDFDLVVLSVGVQTRPAVSLLLDELGIEQTCQGFPVLSEFDPAATSREGVFACGILTGPMDIPESVVSSSAAAASTARYLFQGNGSAPTETAGQNLPDEKDITGIPPRIGVVVCRCGTNIGSVVDVPSTVEQVKGLPNVTFAMETTYACAKDSITALVEEIKQKGVNRVVVASCSPRTHEPLFRSAIREAGLNRYLLQMTNIRDQCSWVHQSEPEDATVKAVDLVRMAVGKARLLKPLSETETAVEKSCIVVGGGIAGMSAALATASSGFPVHVIEHTEALGGNAASMYSTLSVPDVPPFLTEIASRVEANENITVHTGTALEDISGFVGNFTARVIHEGEKQEIRAGTIIVATGGVEHETSSYLYGENPSVITQRELDIMLAHDHPLIGYADSIVMIQCVDSREGDRNYCSRVCCGEAVNNALRIKRRYPRKEVIVLYRDIRTYGLSETFYTDARKAGVIFIRYEEERKPEVAADKEGGITVRCFDEILGEEVTFAADLLALSAGIDAPAGNRILSKALKVPLNEDRFFLEAHVKLRPVDFATEGIFLCGLAHGPKTMVESVTGALAAAGRSLTYLRKETLSSEATTAFINPAICSACGRCVQVCPFSAIEMDEERETAVINQLLCKGCGGCATACFSGAIDIEGFSNKQIMKEFESLFV